MGPVNRVWPQDPYLYDRIEVFTSGREVSGKQSCRLFVFCFKAHGKWPGESASLRAIPWAAEILCILSVRKRRTSSPGILLIYAAGKRTA